MRCEMASQNRRITVPAFSAKKADGQKIAMVTAYDCGTASLVDSAGVDGVLVGDSVAMVVQGRSNTISVTLDEVIYHTRMVTRGVRHALVVADLPFLTYQVSLEKAIENAGRVLQETGCQAVKLEGGADRAPVIAALVAAGIPVMGHCGLRPQSVQQLGGFRVQRDRDQVVADAQALEQAGAFAMVVECVPIDVARDVTAAVSVPTIGIGAGPACDGQILVIHDLLGLTPGRTPRHVKRYAELADTIVDAVGKYRDDVRNGVFPSADESFE